MSGNAAGAKTLTLEKVLDLNEASALQKKLLELSGTDVVIDASGVEKTGAICVQVLMSAARTWEAAGKSFTYSEVSETFSKTLQLIGVNIDPLLAKESK